MKKLGLRAVAGGLAVLMAVAGFAPATASAADVLTAKVPKTLVITADMVDDDGEIVISGEKWDRIIVEKEAAAKDIYFDGVEVGELVVESGSESNIQLWEVAAQQVTVKEPELVELDMVEVRKLLSDKETRAQAMDLYMKVQEDNKKAMNQAPSIVTMDDAVVGAVTVIGSADLDLNKGEVNAFNLEASATVSKVNVTLKGYDGEVTYKGGEKFNIVNFKTVGCDLEKLTVDSAASNNYLNVTSKNSSVANVEVAGNAALSLNIPATKLEIAESATAAQVGILGDVAEMNIVADNATVDVGASAKVAAANVIGDKANLGGLGKVENVEITGTGAYVSTTGSKVKGENTYRPAVYVEPIEDIYYEFNALAAGGWNNTKLESDNGGVSYQLNAGYGGEVFYKLPNVVDTTKYEKAIVKVNVGSNSPDALRVKLTHVGADLDDWGNPIAFATEDVASGTGAYEVVVSFDDHVGKKIDQVRFQSTANGTIGTWYSVTFVARPSQIAVPDAGEKEPVEPITYKAADLKLGGYGFASQEKNEDGSVTTVFSDKGYLEVSFAFPKLVSLEDYASAVIEMSTTAGVFVKTWNAAPLQGKYGDIAYQEAWTNTTSSITVDLRKISVADYTNAGMTYEDLLGVTKVSVMTLDAPADVVVKSITLVPAE